MLRCTHPTPDDNIPNDTLHIECKVQNLFLKAPKVGYAALHPPYGLRPDDNIPNDTLHIECDVQNFFLKAPKVVMLRCTHPTVYSADCCLPKDTVDIRTANVIVSVQNIGLTKPSA